MIHYLHIYFSHTVVIALTNFRIPKLSFLYPNGTTPHHNLRLVNLRAVAKANQKHILYCTSKKKRCVMHSRAKRVKVIP